MEISWVKKAGRIAGSAILEMHNSEAMAALKGLNGQAFHSRRLYIAPLSYAASARKKAQSEEAFKNASAGH